MSKALDPKSAFYIGHNPDHPYYDDWARSHADGGANIKTKHLNINMGEPKMAQETDQERRDRTMLSSVRITDDESKAVQKTEHRVSLDSMMAKIVDEEYIYPACIPHMTICILRTVNGYALVGKSAPADADNFDKQLGMKFAKEDCIRQMWPLEAYLLRERLSL